MHPGLLYSFDEACRKGSKRKRDDTRQLSIEESFAEKPPKAKVKTFTQEEFDDFVVNYVIDGVLPLQHVESEAFTTLMNNVAPGRIIC